MAWRLKEAGTLNSFDSFKPGGRPLEEVGERYSIYLLSRMLLGRTQDSSRFFKEAPLARTNLLVPGFSGK